MITLKMKDSDMKDLVDAMVLDVMKRSGFCRADGPGMDSASIRRRVAKDQGISPSKISPALITGSLKRLANGGQVEIIPGAWKTVWKTGGQDYRQPSSYRLTEEV